MSEETAEDFTEFFLNKINKTQQLFTGIPPNHPTKKPETPSIWEALHHLHKKKSEEK